jgi:hypothetical protein
MFHPESYPGICLPLWFTLHRSDFRLIAENLGNPDQAPWRRTDKYLAASTTKSPRLATLQSLIANQDVLYGPVKDEKAFFRLLDLAETCDAAVLTLLKATWKPAPIRAEGLPVAKLFVLSKLDCLDIKNDELRRDVAHALTAKSSGPWAPDALRLAARMDREVFIDTAIGEVSWAGRPGALQVLREVTGQKYGFEPDRWKTWWSQAKPDTSK